MPIRILGQLEEVVIFLDGGFTKFEFNQTHYTSEIYMFCYLTHYKLPEYKRKCDLKN